MKGHVTFKSYLIGSINFLKKIIPMQTQARREKSEHEQATKKNDLIVMWDAEILLKDVEKQKPLNMSN